MVYFDTAEPDPTLARTPGGDLMIEFNKLNPSGVAGAAYALSKDNGLTWGAFTFFDNPVSNTFAFPAAFLNVGQTMFGASYGPAPDGSDFPFLWFSDDDGVTWTKRSVLRQLDEPGMSETPLRASPPQACWRSADLMTN